MDNIFREVSGEKYDVFGGYREQVDIFDDSEEYVEDTVMDYDISDIIEEDVYMDTDKIYDKSMEYEMQNKGLTELQLKVQQLEKRLQERDNELQELNNRIYNKNRQINELNNTIKGLREINSKLREENKQNKSEVTEIGIDTVEVTAENSKLKEELNALKKVMEENGLDPHKAYMKTSNKLAFNHNANKDLVYELYKSGKSQADIIRITGASRTTIWRRLKEIKNMEELK